ncbi:MAG: aminotransferase class IV [Sumerlaeia bacterium]
MNIVCLNGEFLPLQDARLSPMDAGFLLGDGVFETMRAQDGQVLFAAEHFARLANGLRTLAIPYPVHPEELLSWAHAVLDANGLANARLRLSISRGPVRGGPVSPQEGEPTALLAAFSVDEEALSQSRSRGWHLRTASFPKNHRSPLARIKSLSYAVALMARREAHVSGADAALLLNSEGAIAEADMANLFSVRQNVLLTPPVGDGALPGIMRGQVIRLAREIGYAVHETRLMPEDLGIGGEVFATNAIVRIVPVVRVDDRLIGNGEPGRETVRLTKALGGRIDQMLGAVRRG